MLTPSDPRTTGETARYTARVVFLETPGIAETLSEMAIENGHSRGAEVRAAVRYWLAAWERNSEDGDDD